MLRTIGRPLIIIRRPSKVELGALNGSMSPGLARNLTSENPRLGPRVDLSGLSGYPVWHMDPYGRRCFDSNSVAYIMATRLEREGGTANRGRLDVKGVDNQDWRPSRCKLLLAVRDQDSNPSSRVESIRISRFLHNSRLNVSNLDCRCSG